MLKGLWNSILVLFHNQSLNPQTETKLLQKKGKPILRLAIEDLF